MVLLEDEANKTLYSINWDNPLTLTQIRRTHSKIFQSLDWLCGHFSFPGSKLMHPTEITLPVCVIKRSNFLQGNSARGTRKFIKFLPRVGSASAVYALYFLHCKFAELDFFHIFFIRSGTLMKEMALSSSTWSAERRLLVRSHLQSENEMKTFRCAREADFGRSISPLTLLLGRMDFARSRCIS
jgi:hypothetical protein